MPRGRLLLAGALVAAVGPLLAALPSTAAEPPPRALVSVHEEGIDFAPGGRYSRAILEVSGGEVEFRQTFAAGERTAIGRFDPRGRHLPDGTYIWRLSLIPDEATARELRAAASANGGEAPGAWTAQMGSFTIAGGSFVDPDLVEPTARRQEVRPGLRIEPEAATGAAGPALDTDASVAAGLCEADLHAAVPERREVLSSPHDPTAHRDSDAAIENGAAAEAAIAAPRQDDAAARPRPEADGANGRDRAQ